MSRILVIEDELPMRTALADLLEAAGHRTILCVDGATGLERAFDEQPDLILLDVMMPRLDGYALAADLRRRGRRTPILMLTAKGQTEDRVRGLDAGSDDYLVKPFSGAELLARVRALLRRFERAEPGVADRLVLDDVSIDFTRLEAARRGRPMHLSPKEFAMLKLLAERAGRPVSREEFLDLVWGVGAFPTTRTVDTHMAGLRAKIEKHPDQPRFLKTVHGAGYKLDLASPGPGLTTP
jgi:DNA-binding response OmpR family regulator